MSSEINKEIGVKIKMTLDTIRFATAIAKESIMHPNDYSHIKQDNRGEIVIIRSENPSTFSNKQNM